MRIEKVVIESINSLQGRFEIDLTGADFSEGLFAITGPSGSGKTTVLDAICLALYGKTPRIGRISSSQNEVMNKNAGACAAEVVFTARGRRYRASFSHKRARGKEPFGQPKREVLEYAGEEASVIASSITEADEAISEITGLNYGQFTRSIMLAQFQFAEFLQADTKEKVEILEQISDMGIYRQISAAVFARNKAEGQKLELIRAQQGALTVLEPDEEKQLTAELKTLDARIEAADALQKQFAFCRSALADIDKLGSDLKGFEKARAAADEAHSKQDAKHKKAQADSEAAEKAQRKLAGVLKEVRAIDQELRTADKGLGTLQREADDQKKIIVGKLSEAKDVFQKYMPDSSKQQMREMFNSGDVADIIRAQAQTELKTAQQRQQTLEKQTAAVLGGKTEAQWQQRSDLLRAALPVVRANRAIALAELERDTQRKQIEKLEKKEEAAQKEKTQVDEKLLFYQLQAKYGEERKKLEEGQPCPLCGATSHPGVSAQHSGEALQKHEAQQRALGKQISEIRGDVKAAQRTVDTLGETIKQQKSDLENAEKALAAGGWKLTDIGVDPVDDKAGEKIEAEQADIEKVLREAAKLRQSREAAGKEVLACTARMGDVNADALRVQHAKQEADAAQQRMSKKEEEIDTAQKARDALAQKRRALFGDQDADEQEKKAQDKTQAARDAAEAARSGLEAANRRAAQAVADIARTQQQIKNQQTALDEAYQKAVQALGEAPGEMLPAAQALGKSAQGSRDAISAARGGAGAAGSGGARAQGRAEKPARRQRAKQAQAARSQSQRSGAEKGVRDLGGS